MLEDVRSHKGHEGHKVKNTKNNIFLRALTFVPFASFVVDIVFVSVSIHLPGFTFTADPSEIWRTESNGPVTTWSPGFSPVRTSK